MVQPSHIYRNGLSELKNPSDRSQASQEGPERMSFHFLSGDEKKTKQNSGSKTVSISNEASYLGKDSVNSALRS